MPLPKTATKKQQSKARLLRWQARQAAIRHYGRSAVRNKTVHHKNGNVRDNRPENIDLIAKTKHGRLHGRGVSPKNPLQVKIKRKIKRSIKF